MLCSVWNGYRWGAGAVYTSRQNIMSSLLFFFPLTDFNVWSGGWFVTCGFAHLSASVLRASWFVTLSGLKMWSSDAWWAADCNCSQLQSEVAHRHKTSELELRERFLPPLAHHVVTQGYRGLRKDVCGLLMINLILFFHKLKLSSSICPQCLSVSWNSNTETDNSLNQYLILYLCPVNRYILSVVTVLLLWISPCKHVLQLQIISHHRSFLITWHLLHFPR